MKIKQKDQRALQKLPSVRLMSLGATPGSLIFREAVGAFQPLRCPTGFTRLLGRCICRY